MRIVALDYWEKKDPIAVVDHESHDAASFGRHTTEWFGGHLRVGRIRPGLQSLRLEPDWSPQDLAGLQGGPVQKAGPSGE